MKASDYVNHYLGNPEEGLMELDVMLANNPTSAKFHCFYTVAKEKLERVLKDRFAFTGK